MENFDFFENYVQIEKIYNIFRKIKKIFKMLWPWRGVF